MTTRTAKKGDSREASARFYWGQHPSASPADKAFSQAYGAGFDAGFEAAYDLPKLKRPKLVPKGGGGGAKR